MYLEDYLIRVRCLKKKEFSHIGRILLILHQMR